MKMMTWWNMPSNWLNWLMMSLAWRLKTISFHEPACTQWRQWPMPAQNETHQARRSTRSRWADSREQTLDGQRRVLLSCTLRSIVTMAVVSPGRWLLIFLVFSDLVFNAFANEQKNSGNNKDVVIEILDVTQPYNCSAFFDDLEVRN